MAVNNSGIKFFKIPTGSQTTAQIQAKIAAIDAIIDELLITALAQVTDGGVAEYEIDKGVEYRLTITPGDIYKVNLIDINGREFYKDSIKFTPDEDVEIYVFLEDDFEGAYVLIDLFL